MTPIDRFERQLPMALTDLAVPQTPDYLTDILGQTARTRQRPAWASIERWLPVQLATLRAPVARVPWRQFGALALLALLLAAVLAAYIGSQQRRLPPAFGPAGNGQLVFAQNGDVYTADPTTGASKMIITGPGLELRPLYSPDGTHLLFGRGGALFVTRDDGSGVVQVTPEPLDRLTDWSFSPDGRSVVAFAQGDKGKSIVIVPSDGSGQPRWYPVFATDDDGPPLYRADGSEIMFIGREPAQVNRSVYALDPTSGTVRPLIPPSTILDIHGASWSPDGKNIAYGTYDARELDGASRTHVVGVDGTGDVVLDTSTETIADFGFAWSNDGTRLIITRIYSDDGSMPSRSAIVPTDRSSAGIEIECPPGAPTDDCSAEWSWSPDDSMLIGTLDRIGEPSSQFLADPVTGKVRAAPWTAEGHPAWQRVAR